MSRNTRDTRSSAGFPDLRPYLVVTLSEALCEAEITNLSLNVSVVLNSVIIELH